MNNNILVIHKQIKTWKKTEIFVCLFFCNVKIKYWIDKKKNKNENEKKESGKKIR